MHISDCFDVLHAELDQVWSFLPVVELHPLDWSPVTTRVGATPMQAKWIKLDLIREFTPWSNAEQSP